MISRKLYADKMPEIKHVFANGCGADNDINHFLPIGLDLYIGGHTHICPQDVLRGSVCLANEGILTNSDGTLSEPMWHEYAHVLDVLYNWGAVKVHCGKSIIHAFEYNTKESQLLLYPPAEEKYLFTPNHTHTVTWARIFKRFGYVPNLTCNPPIGKNWEGELIS